MKDGPQNNKNRLSYALDEHTLSRLNRGSLEIKVNMIFYIFGGITINDLCRYDVGRNWGFHFVSFVLHWLLYFYFVLAGRQSSATYGYSIHTLHLITCSIKEKLYNYVNTVI